MENLEVLSGVLSIKRTALLKQKSLDRHLCMLYYGLKSGNDSVSPRIDIYEQNPKNAEKRIFRKTIYIESASWKRIDSIEPAFSFMVKNGKQYIFYCQTKSEQRQWILTLCCISGELYDTKHVVGVSNEGNFVNPSEFSDEYAVVVTNDVYGGVSDVQSFFVLADKSEGCLRFQWRGIFRLIVGHGAVRLMDLRHDALVVEWQITELRNYGHSSNTMFVLSGKRSGTGEGKFIFRTCESSKIIRALSREAELLQTTNHQSIVPSTPQASPPVSDNLRDRPEISTQNSVDSKYFSAEDGSPGPTHSSRISADQQNVGSKKKAPAPLPPKPKISVTNSGQAYNNVGVVNHSGNTSSSGKSLDTDFLKKLDSSLHTNADRKDSVASSNSSDKKEDRKNVQRLKKEQKKQDAERKKLEKKQKEEERKREDQKKKEAKKQKHSQEKEKAKLTQSISNPPPYEPDDVYAEADDFGNSFPKSSLSPISPPEEDHYATTGDCTSTSTSAQQNNPTSEIYHEPWGTLFPQLSPPLSPTAHPSEVSPEYDDDDSEAIYAAPQKKNSESRQPPPVDEPAYEDTDILEPPPTIVPPKWENGSQVDQSDDLYATASLKELPPTYEHVYGMGSASEKFSLGKNESIIVQKSTDVYENMP